MGPAMDYVDQVPLNPLTLEIYGLVGSGGITGMKARRYPRQKHAGAAGLL